MICPFAHLIFIVLGMQVGFPLNFGRLISAVRFLGIILANKEGSNFIGGGGGGYVPHIIRKKILFSKQTMSTASQEST